MKSSAIVDYDKNLLIMVEIDSYSKRIGNECFKIQDLSSKEKRVCQILFRESKYVKNRANNWRMNFDELKNFIKFLKRESKLFQGLTIWQAAIIMFNNEKGLQKPETMENFMDKLKYPDYLPIDLPMPDYTRELYKKKD